MHVTYAEATQRLAFERIVIVPPSAIAMRGANVKTIEVGVIPSWASFNVTLVKPTTVDVGVAVGAFVGAFVGACVGACVAVLESIGVLLVVRVAGVNVTSLLVFNWKFAIRPLFVASSGFAPAAQLDASNAHVMIIGVVATTLSSTPIVKSFWSALAFVVA